MIDKRNQQQIQKICKLYTDVNYQNKVPLWMKGFLLTAWKTNNISVYNGVFEAKTQNLKILTFML